MCQQTKNLHLRQLYPDHLQTIPLTPHAHPFHTHEVSGIPTESNDNSITPSKTKLYKIPKTVPVPPVSVPVPVPIPNRFPIPIPIDTYDTLDEGQRMRLQW